VSFRRRIALVAAARWRSQWCSRRCSPTWSLRPVAQPGRYPATPPRARGHWPAADHRRPEPHSRRRQAPAAIAPRGGTGVGIAAEWFGGEDPRNTSSKANSSRTGNIFGRLPPGPDQVRGYNSGHARVRSSNAGAGSLAPGGCRHTNAGRTRRQAVAPRRTRRRHPSAHPRRAARRRYAVQFAQPLTEVDSLLGRLRLILALLDIGGIALAALLGRVVAGRRRAATQAPHPSHRARRPHTGSKRADRGRRC